MNVDTSAAAVERLAEQCDDRRDDDLCMADTHDGLNNLAHAKAFRASARHYEAAAATLRALAAERDALLADLDAAREALREAENSMNVVRDNLIEDRHHWPEGMLEHAGDLEAAAATARAALARLEASS